jgi:hypothetical protein
MLALLPEVRLLLWSWSSRWFRHPQGSVFRLKRADEPDDLNFAFWHLIFNYHPRRRRSYFEKKISA